MTGNLPSKATLRGVYNLDFVATVADQILGGSFNFPLHLPAVPTVYVLGVGASPTASCPGSVRNPQAAPGTMCVYKESENNTTNFAICNQDCAPIPSAERDGAILYLHSTAAGRTWSQGSWAVTAP